MEKELNVYYSLSECGQTEKVFKYLNKLKEEAKIEWSKQTIDILKIEDIDLEESEVEDLINFLDKMDVIPDTDIDVESDEEDLTDNDDWGYDEDNY